VQLDVAVVILGDMGLTTIKRVGFERDPPYTHSWQFFGRTRSPEAVYSGRYRAMTFTMPASETVRVITFKLIRVSPNAEIRHLTQIDAYSPQTHP
jgi:hypothetical protein